MREQPSPAPPRAEDPGARGTRPVVRLHLAPTLAVALGLALLLALVAEATWEPRGSLAVVMLTAPPLCALVAVAVVVSCARAFEDLRLGWFAVGLGVSSAALVMMMLSRELVDVGGSLQTASSTQAALTLFSYLSLAAGVVLAVLRAPLRLLPVVLALGIVGSAAVVMGLVPLPVLFDGLRITPLMRGASVLTALVTAAAVAVWMRPARRLASALHGWAGAALLLSAAGLLLLAAADEVYSPVWWASITLRTSAYVLLAASSLWWLIASLVSGQVWTQRELTRRDGELEVADALSRQLLHAARRLSEALAVPEVCEAATRLAVEGTAGQEARIVPVGAVGLGAAGGSPGLAEALIARHTAGGPLTSPHFSDPTATAGDRAGSAGSVTGADSGAEGAYAVLPVRADGRLLAHLVLLAAPGRHWTPHDVRFLTALVDQTALALSRGAAYETVAAASATLQASIRPGRQAEVAGLTLHSLYRPVTAGHEVGGDWFDSLALDEDRAVLVVGDVMGKGWRAAAVMGQVRTALRTAASLRLDPADALDMLDRGIVDLGPDEIITVLYALVDRRRGHLSVARAGHPPALLLDAAGDVSFLEAGGSPPIGLPTGPRSEHRVPIEEVSLLVLYTDGVVESRTQDVDDGMAALARRVAAVAQHVRHDGDDGDDGDDGAWDRWLQELHDRDDWQDDVAVLVARFEDVPSAAGPARASLDEEPGRPDAGAPIG